MNGSAPYLSVVVTARNDDHGGNLLRRMQAFVNGWIGQCKRHDVSSEVLVVEWNPPEGKPRLAEVLHWPADLGPCAVRFVEVPAEIHGRYRYADCLPLYQMIAKNAGIRRARGEFVLATNIDVLFSDELMQFFAARRLETGRMYRIDRHDVMSDVPESGTVEEQLAYCRSHLIRINAREGTYKLTEEGSRAPELDDIVIPGSCITFGDGWFPVERLPGGEVFRWAATDAEVIARLPADPSPPTLEFEIEPGPAVNYGHMRLQVVDEEGVALAEAVVRRRSRLRLTIPQTTQPFRRFRLRVLGGGYPTPRDPRILNFRVFACKWVAEAASSSPLDGYRLSVLPGRVLSPGRLRQAAELCLHAGSAWRAALVVPRYFIRTRKFKIKLAKGEDVFQRGSGIRPGLGWYPLEYCYGEGFRWVRKNAALIVSAPDGEPRKLLLQIEPGPGVNNGAFELLVRDASGAVVTSAIVRRGPQLLALDIPYYPGQVEQFVLTLEGGDRPARNDPRILNFRISWCGWSLDRGAQEEIEQVDDGNADAPVFLHTNGCGDFTLMAREHWFDVRGYPEFDLFSMNIDSVLCYTAHHAGFREQVLNDPMRIYHIEHGTGSGWTPEGQTKLFTRLAEKGITFVDYQQVVSWAIDMRRMNSPMIFNVQNWGLASDELAEREVLSDSCSRVSG